MNTLHKSKIKKQLINAGIRSYGSNGSLFVFHEVSIPDELKKFQAQQAYNKKIKMH